MSQVRVCPSSQPHFFKAIRGKTRQVGKEWHFWEKCNRCTALLNTIVTHKTAPNGDTVPTARAYIITAFGSAPIKTRVQPADVPTEPEEGQEEAAEQP